MESIKTVMLESCKFHPAVFLNVLLKLGYMGM